MYNVNFEKFNPLEEDSIIFETHYPYLSYYLYHSQNKSFDENWENNRENAMESIRTEKIYPITDDFDINSIKNTQTDEYLIMMFRFDWNKTLNYNKYYKELYRYIVYKDKVAYSLLEDFINKEFFSEVIVNINNLYKKDLFYYSPPFLSIRDKFTTQMYLVGLLNIEKIFEEPPFSNIKFSSISHFLECYEVELVVFYYLNKFDTSEKHLKKLYEKSSEVPFYIHHLKKKRRLLKYLYNEYEFLFGYCLQKLKIDFSFHNFKYYYYFLDIIREDSYYYDVLITLLANEESKEKILQSKKKVLDDFYNDFTITDFDPRHFYYSPKTLRINSTYIRFFAYKKIEIKEYSNWEETLVSRQTPQFNTLYLVFITKELEDEESKSEDGPTDMDIQQIFVSKSLDKIMKEVMDYVKRNDIELLSNIEK